MKLLSFLIISTIILTTYKFELRNAVKKEWYAQKVDDNNANYIELITNGDAVEGFFYGVERLPDRTVIYYKAPLDSINLKENEFRFLLMRFDYSRQAFDGSKATTLMSHDDPNIPLILRHGISYFGNKYPDTLKLHRILSLYDNRSDDAVFVKVAARN
ncbi:MAG TPA: hypothetical protein VMH27_19145 [Puia sp.]|nr:hypothetical protein [Puia sp.]